MVLGGLLFVLCICALITTVIICFTSYYYYSILLFVISLILFLITITLFHKKTNKYPLNDIEKCDILKDFCTKSSEDKKIMEREAGRFVLSVAAAKKLNGYGIKKTVAVFHYPPMFDKFVYDRLFDIMLDNRIEECYFGHLHGKISPTAALCEKYHIICKLISADFLKFSPLKLT
jgi:predicted phosphohydrolase